MYVDIQGILIPYSSAPSDTTHRNLGSRLEWRLPRSRCLPVLQSNGQSISNIQLISESKNKLFQRDVSTWLRALPLQPLVSLDMLIVPCIEIRHIKYRVTGGRYCVVVYWYRLELVRLQKSCQTAGIAVWRCFSAGQASPPRASILAYIGAFAHLP